MYNISINQENAIWKMENFCGIKSHKTIFESKAEFDEYFELLQKKWNKKKKLLDNVSSWKISFEEINRKKRKKILDYYNTEKWLEVYATKYVDKYTPTYNKLLNKLVEKSKNDELAKTIADKYVKTINEESLIKSYINHYIIMWKNIRYIKTKLYQKLFNKDLIEKEINLLKEEDTFLDEFTLSRKVKNLMNKWKPISYVKNKLIDRPEDQEIVNKIINEIYINWDFDVLEKEIIKLKEKNIEKDKIIQKLLSKWFMYWDIKDFF